MLGTRPGPSQVRSRTRGCSLCLLGVTALEPSDARPERSEPRAPGRLERWPCRLSLSLPGPRRLLWVNSECFDPEMPHLELTYQFCFVLFYVRASNLSFIPPSKVEYLHFCFDCLTNFSIVTEWLPMSNEVHGFLKGGAFPFFFFQGGHF